MSAKLTRQVQGREGKMGSLVLVRQAIGGGLRRAGGEAELNPRKNCLPNHPKLVTQKERDDYYAMVYFQVEKDMLPTTTIKSKLKEVLYYGICRSFWVHIVLFLFRR